MSSKRHSFVERVLDGHARIDEFEAQVAAWLDGPRTKPLHEVLGLSADELDLVASTPDALRYVLNARRFDRSVALDELRGQPRVRALASRLASRVVDPHDAADVEAWIPHVDAAASASRAEREPSHA